MENVSNFDWGYFFTILRVSGCIPYLPKSDENRSAPTKWQLVSLLHIIFSFYLCLQLFYNIPAFNEHEILALLFLGLDILGYPLSIAFGLMCILKRRHKIIDVMESFSRISQYLSIGSFQNERKKDLFKYFYFFLNILFAICIYYVEFVVPYFMLIVYGNNAVLLMDVNFCIFLINTKFLFRCLTENIFKLKTKKYIFVNDLATLRKIYIDCCEIAESVGKCFLDIILVYIGIEFVCFVFTIYYTFKNMNVEKCINVCFWFVFISGKFIAKLSICSDTTKEVTI